MCRLEEGGSLYKTVKEECLNIFSTIKEISSEEMFL